jgi:hypothetical protein
MMALRKIPTMAAMARPERWMYHTVPGTVI